MKQKILLKLFRKNGWWIHREGGRHIIMTNGKAFEPIPRHKEINEMLAQSIIKRCDLK